MVKVEAEEEEKGNLEKAEEVEVDAKSIPVFFMNFMLQKMDQGKEDEERDDRMENPETKV